MHKEPSNKEEIPELCKQTFVSTRAGLAVIWILAGLLISCTGTAVSWVMATDKLITEIKSVQTLLQDQINAKLDVLIKAKQEEEK